jgi:hypothetical protein
MELILIKISLHNKCQGDMVTNIFKPIIFFPLGFLSNSKCPSCVPIKMRWLLKSLFD